MCGIFGVVGRSNLIDRMVLSDIISKLFLLSETRGKESAGLAIVGPNAIQFQKSAVRPRDFVRTSSFKEFVEQALDSAYAQPHGLAVFGHSRLVTNGGQNIHENNQPVHSGGLLAVHNGIIVNDDDLWRRSNALRKQSEVDTEVMLQLLRAHLDDGQKLSEALRSTFRSMVGTVSTAIAAEDLNVFILATNNGSLYFTRNEQSGIILFASERYILEDLLNRHKKDLPRSFGAVKQLPADSALVIDLDDLMMHQVDLVDQPAVPLESKLKQRPISDETPLGERTKHSINSMPKPAKTNFACYEIDPEPIRALKRCTRCILPETVPFITFDADGICSFCRDYKPKTYLGRAALEVEAERLKALGGEGPNCLFTLSGGRDSCYGLHYAVKELGLKPVTYTYDWGMITDLARRNQARMCGALKVEHILVSADISEKRANIRRNVSAWLKKPDLGMIPLFMAGDKQYFFYANQLAKRLNLDTTVLASNPLEKTHFKAGFCGVPPARDHRPSLMSQLRLATYFGRQFLTNPGYINRSLLDTAGAFGSYYFISHKYLRIFDYVPWIEEEVNDTLRNVYEWEGAKDTSTTWRIGDGTAAFYNYIYYRVAGFTENDTFRSNQIREGVLDRATALRRVEDENAPRFESIAWYCSVIGLGPEEVLARIAGIQPLYPVNH